MQNEIWKHEPQLDKISSGKLEITNCEGKKLCAGRYGRGIEVRIYIRRQYAIEAYVKYNWGVDNKFFVMNFI